MIAICRNKNCEKPGGEYSAGNQQGVPPGYCTKKCALIVAKHHGWSESREKKGGLTYLEVLKNAGAWGRIKKPKTAVDKVLSTSTAMILSPKAQEIAKRFEATTLTFSLTVPEPEILEMLKDPQSHVAGARALPLQDDDDYKMMDLERTRLLDEADEIEKARTDGTKPINAVKRGWDDQFTPGIKGRGDAALLLSQRMKAYETAKRERLAAEEAEKRRLAQLEKDRLEQEAERKRREAEKAKGPKKDELLRTADSLHRAADMTPTEFTTPATADTPTGGSSKAKLWKGSRDEAETTREALRSLLQLSDDWDLDEVVGFKQSGLNSLAKNFKNARQLRGFKFEEDTNFRRGKR